MDIRNLPARELRKKLSSKEVSAGEIIRAYIDNIRDEDDIFLTLNKEDAINRAAIIDEKIKNGERIGLLAGLPIGIKDNIVTKGIKTTCGSKILNNFIPPYDASVVERIKSADGIILGKTNMDEFSLGNMDKTGQAVGQGQVALGLASDTSGELRQAAYQNKIVGIKPTTGIVSRYGLIPVANTMDQIGVYGRDVEDATYILSAITGFDKRDSTSFKNPEGTIVFGNFSKKIDRTYLKGMKIGIIKEFLGGNDLSESLGLLEDLGGNMEEVTMESLKYGDIVQEAISAAEFSSNMARFDGVRYGYRTENYNSLDELYINTRTEALGEEVKRKIVLGTYLLSRDSKDLYEKATRIRSLIRQDFARAFDKYDILLTPMDLNNNNLFTGSVNLGGYCAISLKGVQLIGDRYKEVNIIKAAFGLEGGLTNGI